MCRETEHLNVKIPQTLFKIQYTRFGLICFNNWPPVLNPFFFLDLGNLLWLYKKYKIHVFFVLNPQVFWIEIPCFSPKVKQPCLWSEGYSSLILWFWLGLEILWKKACCFWCVKLLSFDCKCILKKLWHVTLFHSENDLPCYHSSYY